MYVVYHDNCYDGWTAAWVAKRAYPGAVLLPMKYGDPAPVIPRGSTVYFIDISMKRPDTMVLAEKYKLRILDHHKTAQAELENLSFAVFNMEKSGAMLAWEEFFPGKPAPDLVEYIQDADLWKWKLSASQEVNTYIRSFARNIGNYDYLCERLEGSISRGSDGKPAPELDPLNQQVGEVVELGRAIMGADEQRVEEMCEQAIMGTLGGYKIPLANSSVLFSAVGHRLLQLYPEAPFAGYFFVRADKVVQFGLRGRGDFDTSAVAKQYGGGGHFSASGFQQTVEQLNEIIA